MEFTDFLPFITLERKDDAPRVAELAAMILARSATVSPIAITIEIESEGTIFPKPEFSLKPYQAAAIAEVLIQRATAIHKLAEHDSNYGLNASQEKRRDKLAAECVKIGELLGFKVETGGDPRGCVVKLIDPQDERAGDNWGGGWGVYR
jgi:hypothetical protein